MQKNEPEEGKRVPSSYLIGELKRAYRSRNSFVVEADVASFYKHITQEEVLWYALNKGNELPENREEYIGALSLLSHSKLTEEERRSLALTLMEVDGVLVKAWKRNKQWSLAFWAIEIPVIGYLVVSNPGFIIFFWITFSGAYHTNYVSTKNALTLRKSYLTLLGDLQIPEAVPFLAQTDRFPLRLRETATKSLYQLLPTLTPAHYRAFSKETVPNLCSLLSNEIRRLSPSNLERATLMVEALEKMGDSRAILTVEALQRELREKQKSFEELQLRAQSATWNRNVYETAAPPEIRSVSNPYFELQNKVSHLLYVLLERRIQEEQHDTLLRGSSAPVDTSQLLRPITGKPEQEPAEQLLRVRDIDKP